MANILITGGAGFIGSNLAKRCVDPGGSLSSRGGKVVVLDDLSGGYANQVPPGAEFVKGSILDRVVLTALFERYKFDYVFHLAAYAAEGLSHFIRRYNYTNNVIGSMNLINLAVQHKVKRFVFTSSIAVYGPNQLPYREEMSPEPEDPYGIAKYAVELDLRAAHSMFGLNYTIFRPHNVYGPNQNVFDHFRNVVGIFMRQLLAREALSVFGDGQQVRAFTHINDVTLPMAECLTRPDTAGEIFNVGSDTAVSINELAALLMKTMNLHSEIRYLPARNELIKVFSDHTKMKKFFPHLKHPIPLAEGLESMVTWVKNVHQLQTPAEKLPFEVELTEKLPKIWRQPLGLTEKS